MILQVGMHHYGYTRDWMGGCEATVVRVNKKTATVRIDDYPYELHRVDLDKCIRSYQFRADKGPWRLD